MFLQSLIRRNPEFVVAAVRLHQDGRIPANSYVLDLDTIAVNTSTFVGAAHGHGLTVLAMTKQIGRARPALDVIARGGGVDGFVAVDMACARPIAAAGHRVGHVGHLVQVPRHEAPAVAAMSPTYWTVFSDDKAAEASAASAAIGVQQQLLARIQAPGDTFYPGHEGGFDAEDVVAVADRIDALPNVSFAGITTFPALLFDQAARGVTPTPNLATLERAANRLRDAGRDGVGVNAPGTTSIDVLESLASAGATQVEPGHGLTGTTPLHAVTDCPELPAALYLTEVSHQHAGRAYCFGGGLYIDRVFDPYQVTALVGGSSDEVLQTEPVPAELPPPEAIDYYGQLLVPGNRQVGTGDTVVFGFRFQAFFTRAFIVPIAGVLSGRPRVEGIWRGDGSRIDGEGSAT
jgi:predicted amino acid racemase